METKLKEFVSLVKKMREAQQELDIYKTMIGPKRKAGEEIDGELYISLATAFINAVFYEDKVDEMLKEWEGK